MMSAKAVQNETGADVISMLKAQHERVSLLLQRLDGGRWWCQIEPTRHAEDVRKQVAIIKAALDHIDVSVVEMMGI